MNFPKVSIITVVYNDVKNIEKTIQNVLKQTYPNLEYVVVDGASSDGTLEIIKKYDKQLRWLSEIDKGIYDAMQKGAEMATGDWILFRNCGDFFINPTAIEDLFAQYDEDKGEDFLLADSRYFKNYGYKDVKPSILTKSYFESMPVTHPSTFIRRTTQLRFPFHLEYNNSADYCFFVESFSNGATFRYFDIIIGLFDNETGASADNYDKSMAENIDILKKNGAPLNRINMLKYRLIICKFKKILKRYLPLYSLYHKKHLKSEGWIKSDRINHFRPP